ncbi:MAG: hypothetical protein IJ944_05805 [Clostridia bacterium]|nr:hypothetical protein [Clostridia bacterium]
MIPKPNAKRKNSLIFFAIAVVGTVLFIGMQTAKINRHTHIWSEATCELPSTCTSCGATQGNALNHSWLEATCDRPKICSTCELTEGTNLGHSYQKGICARCGAEDPSFFNASKYGFINNYNKTAWLEIAGYQIDDNTPTVFQSSFGGRSHYLFEDGIIYSPLMVGGTIKKSSVEANYRIVNNDTIIYDGNETMAIVDRIYNDKGYLILKISDTYKLKTRYFALYDQIDWSKPIVETPGEEWWSDDGIYHVRGSTTTYYLKKNP